MESSWKQFRYRLETAGVGLLAAGIPLLPRRVCVRAANGMGALVFALDRRGRNVALGNLEAAFGDSLTAHRRRQIARASYQNFARTMLDLFWSKNLTEENFSRYIKVEGAEILGALRGKPVVAICVHTAGFEWGSLVQGFYGNTGCVLTQAFENEPLNAIFARLRGASGHEMITQNFSMLKMLRRVKNGGTVGMLVDLNVSPSQAGTVIETFGMKMCTTFLHAILALRAGASLMPIASEPFPDGTTRVTVSSPLAVPPDADEQQIAQICWDFFEPIIREKPEAWMWAYKHWRFKPKNAKRPYPFYANTSGKFEKLLRRVTKNMQNSQN